jgi:glycosyltransferase involved in cell wall biosynthesis
VLTVGVDCTPLVGRRTGIGNTVHELLGALVAADDGTVALTGYGLTWRGRTKLPPLLPPGVRLAPRPIPASPVLALWGRVAWPPIEWWTGRLQVVHGTNAVVPPSRAARLVTVHDVSWITFPELVGAASRRYPRLVRAAVRQGAVVHTPSAYVAGEITDLFGVPEERVRVIPWGVDAEGLARRAESGVGRGQPDARRPYLLAVGTSEPRKDLPGLVAAFGAVADQVADVELVLAGAPGWGEDALQVAIGRLPPRVRARVRREGWVGDPAPLIAGAAALAYPSLYEGFGLPPLEAMTLGVPVVTTAAGAIPEVVADAALLVPPRDVDALADGLLAVLTDRARRDRLVAAGRARAQSYRWSDTASAFLRLYRELDSSQRIG